MLEGYSFPQLIRSISDFSDSTLALQYAMEYSGLPTRESCHGGRFQIEKDECQISQKDLVGQ